MITETVITKIIKKVKKDIYSYFGTEISFKDDSIDEIYDLSEFVKDVIDIDDNIIKVASLVSDSRIIDKPNVGLYNVYIDCESFYFTSLYWFYFDHNKIINEFADICFYYDNKYLKISLYTHLDTRVKKHLTHYTYNVNGEKGPSPYNENGLAKISYIYNYDMTIILCTNYKDCIIPYTKVEERDEKILDWIYRNDVLIDYYGNILGENNISAFKFKFGGYIE